MAKKIKENHLPSISVVTATYDGSLRILDRCLKLVRGQNYPQEKIEIILGHGGSKEKIIPIAKKYMAKVFLIPKAKQNAEYNRGVAFNKATGKLAIILDNDNFLPYKNWLKDMVEPFLKQSDLVAAETCFYHYDRNLSLIDRYFALFGTSEPLPYYLKKADRMPWGTKSWTLQGKARDMGGYYLVSFEKKPSKIPSIGTNGCIMRRKLIIENAKADPKNHYPIDVMVDMIMKGYNKFAFVKNSIIHDTGYVGFIPFLKRRYKFAYSYHFQDISRRRWSVYTKDDFWKVIYFVIISLTFLKPAYDALKGYFRIKDIAWFLHPVMAFATTILYGHMAINNKLQSVIKNER